MELRKPNTICIYIQIYKRILFGFFKISVGINALNYYLKLKANKGKKVDDPFTRRHTKPVMNFKSHQGGRSQVSQ